MNCVFTPDSVFKSILLKTQNSHKIFQQVYGPNRSLDNLLQLTQTVYYSREYEGKKDRQKKTKKQAEALVMAVRTVLKQPKKTAQRDPGEKGWVAITVERRGTSSGIARRQLSRPGSMSALQGTTLEDRLPPGA